MKEIPKLTHTNAIITTSNGPVKQKEKSDVVPDISPIHTEPIAHLESAGLFFSIESKEKQELSALTTLLPRYLHDLKNVFARLVIYSDDLEGSLEESNIPEALREFAKYSSSLIASPQDTNFSRWEEIIQQDNQDRSPIEVLDQAKKQGGVLEKELKLKICPLIEFAKTYNTSDQSITLLLKAIESSGSEILQSINTFNTTESYSNYRGKPKTFNPFDLLCKSFNSLELSTSGKVLDIEKPIMQGVSCFISMDPTLFICSIENIVKNAAKAAVKAQFPPKEVHFRATVISKEDKVQIILEDTGPGMPDSSIRKILAKEEFSETLGESKEKGGGNNQGFGIQNVIRNIELAGGIVIPSSSQNASNHFTKFVIELPALPNTNPVASSYGDSTVSIHSETIKKVIATSEDRNESSPVETILVIRKYGAEDIAGILRQGKENEYRIITAKNFEEALVLVEKYKPGLIISEFKSPGSEQTACEMLDHIARNQGKLPKVILVRTGSDLQLEGVQAFQDDLNVIDLDEAVKDILNKTID